MLHVPDLIIPIKFICSFSEGSKYKSREGKKYIFLKDMNITNSGHWISSTLSCWNINSELIQLHESHKQFPLDLNWFFKKINLESEQLLYLNTSKQFAFSIEYSIKVEYIVRLSCSENFNTPLRVLNNLRYPLWYIPWSLCTQRKFLSGIQIELKLLFTKTCWY